MSQMNSWPIFFNFFCCEQMRSALGKALVRIHRDRREIQYIVLVSIRKLVQECPSAFSPFLNDFFVKGMDPSFTAMIKLDILVSLSTDPKSINAVLTELRSYVRHSDKAFVCAAISSVGKVAELARVVYDRRAQTADELDATSARAESNDIALNCLSGLVTLSEYSKNAEVVGQCAETIQRILSQLLSDDGMTNTVKDPTGIQERALKRLLLILVRSLNSSSDYVDEDEEIATEQTQLQLKTVRVPDSAVASIIFIVGEWLTMLPKSISSPWIIDENEKSKLRLEVLRLMAKQFTILNPQIKLQAVHFASKVLLALKVDQMTTSSDSSTKQCAASELILAMARVDVLQDVRDRARYEGNALHMSVGLSHDTSALQPLPPNANTTISVEKAKTMLQHRKPNASSLPLDSKELDTATRFGSLSNILNSRTMGSTTPLPVWAEKNSPGTLRDSSSATKKSEDDANMYNSSSEDESSSSDDSSSSSSSSGSSDESEDESSDSESSDEESTTGSNVIGNGGFNIAKPIMSTAPAQNTASNVPSLLNNDADGDDSSSSESSSSDSDSDNDDSSSQRSSEKPASKGEVNTDLTVLPSVGDILDMGTTTDLSQVLSKQTSSASSVSTGLEGLIMSPLVGDKDDINKPSNIDEESSLWKEYVKPELSSGLLIKMRFVRGRSRTKEAQLLGLDSKNPSTVCLQVHVENM